VPKSFCFEQSQNHKRRTTEYVTKEVETASSDTQTKKLQNGITAQRGPASTARTPYNKVIPTHQAMETEEVEVSGQLHDPVALPQEIQPPVSTGCKTVAFKCQPGDRNRTDVSRGFGSICIHLPGLGHIHIRRNLLFTIILTVGRYIITVIRKQ
jgi:hypothetical protein